MHISHPLLRPGTLEAREYQQQIFAKAAEKNVLVVLPTGLGKTPIAILLAAHRLEKFPGSKIMVLAPTKPLSEQHRKSFAHFLNMESDKFAAITGAIPPQKRAKIYSDGQLFFATPQTVENDINSGIFSFKDFSLLVIDEMHRGVGKYAYPFVAQKYAEQAANARILGLTASPSSDYETVNEICENAYIEDVEIRAEEDEDVAPYVQQKILEWVDVELPSSFLEIRSRLAEAYEEKVESLRKMGLRIPAKAGKKVLLSFQKSLIRELSSGNRRAIIAMSMLNQAIKIDHALTLLETQGIVSLENYFKKLREDPKAQRLLKNRKVEQAQFLANSLFLSGAKHPKMAMLCSIVSAELARSAESKIIVFANYRDMVGQIVDSLSKIENARPVAFMGQKSLSQKEQIAILEDFRSGKYNVLVGTSVSEEGLDIPAMDTAVFYEPVPSEIRSIQRRGRVGRHSAGRVIVLITKKTRDEAFYWSARNKERKMKRIMRGMKGGMISGFANTNSG